MQQYSFCASFLPLTSLLHPVFPHLARRPPARLMVMMGLMSGFLSPQSPSKSYMPPFIGGCSYSPPKNENIALSIYPVSERGGEIRPPNRRRPSSVHPVISASGLAWRVACFSPSERERTRSLAPARARPPARLSGFCCLAFGGTGERASERREIATVWSRSCTSTTWIPVPLTTCQAYLLHTGLPRCDET